jgi:hypothetical protein
MHLWILKQKESSIGEEHSILHEQSSISFHIEQGVESLFPPCLC